MSRGKTQQTAKAEETREKILDAALRLFRDQGFDGTTMREIATAAGVATGAAYYYFRAKEDLVMAFYLRTAEQSRQVVPEALAAAKGDLRKRLRALIDQKFEQFGEHRRLLGALVRIGIDPAHALSPFGEETAPMRDESIESFRLAIDGSGTRIPKDLHDQLPRLLWLYQMGLILFWIFDESPGQRRTRKLTDGTLDLIVRLIQLSSLPLLGTIRKKALAVLKDVEE